MPADTRYRPPTKVTSLELPFLALVTRADPDWARAKHREQTYPDTPGIGFSNGKIFYGNPTNSGAYDGTSGVVATGLFSEPHIFDLTHIFTVGT